MFRKAIWAASLAAALVLTTSAISAQDATPEMPSGAMQGDGFVFGDARLDAPELAPRGDYGVGVQTLDLVNPGQIDILNVSESNPDPTYDRPITVEVWYPATGVDADATIEYQETLGRADNPNDPLVPFTFSGRAQRDADIDGEDGPYPLLIVSHGYPGSRYIMSYLGENLASKGYVVVSIDHTDSTFSDVTQFSSTLYNRPLDILFVLNQMAAFGAADSDSFLSGVVDANNTGLIGYSLGGYGVINAAGGGFGASYVPVLTQFGIPGVERFASLTTGNADFEARQDDRIKAVFAFAPWGMNLNLWDADSLAALTVPLFLVAGSQDDISGYETGTRLVYENTVNSDRYLLTLDGARHNVAPNPPPAAATNYDQYMRYADSVWDSHRMNNIMEHFTTAFFGSILKGETEDAAYLDLIEVAADGVYSVNDDGTFAEDNTYWLGFQPRSAVGMRLEHAAHAG